MAICRNLPSGCRTANLEPLRTVTYLASRCRAVGGVFGDLKFHTIKQLVRTFGVKKLAILAKIAVLRPMARLPS